MASIVARLGPFEPRTISILRRPGKRRKQNQRTCVDGQPVSTPSICKSVRTYIQDATTRRKATIRNHSISGSGRSEISFTKRPLISEEVDVKSRRHASSSSIDVEDALREGQTYNCTDGAQSLLNENEERAIGLMQQWETDIPGTDVEDVSPEHAVSQQAQKAQDASWSKTAISVHDSWARTRKMKLDTSAEYKIDLRQALLEGESDRLLRAFVAASNDIDFVASIPDTTFSQILHTIRPEKLLLPLAQIHTTLSAATAHKMGVTPIHQVVEDYLHAVLDVLTVRKEAGKHLNIGDYTMLLKCARQTGSWPVAKSLWNAMIRDGITPNTPCYNHYMASMILKDVYDARTRHRIRVTPLHMRARTVKVQGSGFRNYRVGDGGIKSRVMKIFSEMLSNEAVADEETFRIVIEGAGREGDLTVIKSVLKKVWEINVDGLMSADDASLLPPPTQLPERSLLYPTDGLLFTIAHAFSINNNIPAALRLVDYISRQYRVPITDRVWEVLFEWTYVLSKHRVKYEDPLRQGDLLGQLPKQSLKNLWDTMTGAPYYYSPSAPMYNHLIANLAARDRPCDMWHYMEDGRQLYIRSRDRTRVAYETLRSALDERSPRHAGGIEELQRDLDQADLLRQRNLGYLKRWLRLLLRAMRSYNRVNKDLEWSTRMIPRILSEWADFAPRVVRYETAGGNVEILFRPQCDVDEERRRGEERARRIAKVLQARPRFLGQNWTPRKWMARTSHERLSEDGPPQGT